MKDLEFTAPEKARNATFAVDEDSQTLWVKIDLEGERFRAKTGNKGEMIAKLHTVYDNGVERFRFGFNVMPVVKKSVVLNQNAALQAKIKELEAKLAK